jgi:hypothetical protein
MSSCGWVSSLSRSSSHQRGGGDEQGSHTLLASLDAERDR